MKKVTKDEFYNTVGQLDVAVSVVGNYPYSCLFKTRSGEIKGKIVDVMQEGRGLPVSEYFSAI